MTRRENDFYPTLDNNAIERLMTYWDIWVDADIFEPCAGDLHLVKQLKDLEYYSVQYTDLKILGDCKYFDATSKYMWEDREAEKGKPDFTITNSPFALAPKILPLAYEYSKYGVAMLLRLSYLEPCKNRAVWLAEHPISKIISIPRISFTGDGKSDFVATAWFVWDKRTDEQEIVVSP